MAGHAALASVRSADSRGAGRRAGAARPSARGQEEGAEAGTLAVYRDQLDEIEAERARGLVDEAEAVAARTEISRRLLASAAAEDAGAGTPPRAIAVRAPGGDRGRRCSPLLTLGALSHARLAGPAAYPMAGALAVLRSRRPHVGDLIAKVEARLREHPEDGEGWDVIAPVYFKLGRFRDAADAYARAAAPQGRERASGWSGFAEASRARRRRHRHRGRPSRLREDPETRARPRRSRASGWRWPRSRTASSPTPLAEYKALLAEAPADAPWRGALERRIAEVSERLAGARKAAAARAHRRRTWPPPRSWLPQDRARMIAQMVDGLAQRLKRDGRDLAGWLRLVNAYVVLGRKNDARAALAEARKNFGGDEKALAELAALAKSLGLGS